MKRGTINIVVVIDNKVDTTQCRSFDISEFRDKTTRKAEDHFRSILYDDAPDLTLDDINDAIDDGYYKLSTKKGFVSLYQGTLEDTGQYRKQKEVEEKENAVFRPIIQTTLEQDRHSCEVALMGVQAYQDSKKM